ncbi:MAG: rod shape-determining protein MreB [Alphaproteobacteria bacterium]|nr:rod shape-determining protein MreB [Alphaproteobacteria bacterium]
MLGLGRSGTDVAVDLGSTLTRVVTADPPSFAELHSVLVMQEDAEGRRATGFGEQARQLLGRTSSGTKVVQPIRGGAVEEFEAAELLLAHVIGLVERARQRSPRLLLPIRTDATEVERRALQELGRAAGAREVRLVQAPLAAALGAQLPISGPTGSMVVDVGGGRTDVAVLALGGLVIRRSIKVAGETLDARIAQWLRREHGLVVPPSTAERIKVEVGAARPTDRVVQTRIRGRDLSTGAPKVLDVHGGHVAEAIAEPIERIRATVLEVLRELPPELSADVLASGVMLVGGASQLRLLDRVLAEATGLAFLHADRPSACTALGLQRLLADPQLLDSATATA